MEMSNEQENKIKEILQDFANDCLQMPKYSDGTYYPYELQKEIEETFIKIKNENS